MGKARSPNKWINLSVRRTFATLTSLSIEPKIIYIESAKNPADPISRGILGHPEDRLATFIELPDELHDILSYA